MLQILLFSAALLFSPLLSEAEEMPQYRALDGAEHRITIRPLDNTIAHVADGQGWSTQLVFVNLENFPRRINVYFRASDGSQLWLNFEEFLGTSSAATISIPPLGLGTLTTTGTSFPTAGGWSMYLADDGRLTPIAGMALFTWRRPGYPDQEAVVPFSSPVEGEQTLVFDNYVGFLTGMAIANPSRQNMTVFLSFYTLNGAFLGSRSIFMGPWNHRAFLLPSQFPALAGHVGTVRITGSAFVGTVEVNPLVLGLRFNPTGAFSTIFPLSLP